MTDRERDREPARLPAYRCASCKQAITPHMRHTCDKCGICSARFAIAGDLEKHRCEPIPPLDTLRAQIDAFVHIAGAEAPKKKAAAPRKKPVAADDAALVAAAADDGSVTPVWAHAVAPDTPAAPKKKAAPRKKPADPVADDAAAVADE
jgi:hypothetical protein